jgi:hypothetical protein
MCLTRRVSEGRPLFIYLTRRAESRGRGSRQKQTWSTLRLTIISCLARPNHRYYVQLCKLNAILESDVPLPTDLLTMLSSTARRYVESIMSCKYTHRSIKATGRCAQHLVPLGANHLCCSLLRGMITALCFYTTPRGGKGVVTTNIGSAAYSGLPMTSLYPMSEPPGPQLYRYNI